jgi:hypothetical protein
MDRFPWEARDAPSPSGRDSKLDALTTSPLSPDRHLRGRLRNAERSFRGSRATATCSAECPLRVAPARTIASSERRGARSAVLAAPRATSPWRSKNSRCAVPVHEDDDRGLRRGSPPLVAPFDEERPAAAADFPVPRVLTQSVQVRVPVGSAEAHHRSLGVWAGGRSCCAWPGKRRVRVPTLMHQRRIGRSSSRNAWTSDANAGGC